MNDHLHRITKKEKNKMSEKKELFFISRHDPNDGEVALAKTLGYDSIKQIPITFSEDPVSDLQNNGIEDKKIAIVAPSYITNLLLNTGYELIEFVNSPIKREKMVFCCEGAYIYKLSDFTKELNTAIAKVSFDNSFAPNFFTELPARIRGDIKQKYIQCPLSVDQQIESSLYTLPLPEGYVKIKKVSEYFGSHEEQGEGDKEEEFIIAKELKDGAMMFELKHGHNSSNHEEFMQKYNAVTIDDYEDYVRYGISKEKLNEYPIILKLYRQDPRFKSLYKKSK